MYCQRNHLKIQGLELLWWLLRTQDNLANKVIINQGYKV